jgi:hypothetical protein
MENYYPGYSFLELTTLYRDCYSVGRGFISSDVFIAVANE